MFSFSLCANIDHHRLNAGTLASPSERGPRAALYIICDARMGVGNMCVCVWVARAHTPLRSYPLVGWQLTRAPHSFCHHPFATLRSTSLCHAQIQHTTLIYKKSEMMNLSRMLFHPSEIPWAIRVYPRGNEIQDPENCDVQQCVLLHIGNVCDVNQYVCVLCICWTFRW